MPRLISTFKYSVRYRLICRAYFLLYSNYSENNDEFNKVAYKYYYKLKDIINDFSIKNNIGLENDNAIINKLNEIIHQINKTKINIILDRSNFSLFTINKFWGY